LEHGANVNVKNNDDITPLFEATQNRNMRIMELLLKNKADPNQKSVGGKTPLSVANEYKSRVLIKLLIKYGAGTKSAASPEESTVQP
jgi:ankyrin repeat protein